MDEPSISQRTAAGRGRFTKGERVGIAVGLCVLLIFLGNVERRTAFRDTHPMTDLLVYMRAGWAVRTGHDIYQVTELHGWHYLYPPTFAILFSPLGEGPNPKEALYYGQRRWRDWIDPVHGWHMAAVVAIWYCLSLAALAWGSHALASAIEEHPGPRPIAPRFTPRERWWLLRMAPVVTCLPLIGDDLSRGQVELVLVALLMLSMAAGIRRRDFRAGLWLSAAIVLKLLPALLLIYPLWRRRWRWVAGCAAGCAIGFVAIPALALGPTRTIDYYREFYRVMALPSLGKGTDTSRTEEFFELGGTDNQSLLQIINNLRHMDLSHEQRRGMAASQGTRIASAAIGCGMIALTILAAGWRRTDSGPGLALFVGALVLPMAALSPVCHSFYFAMLAPLVMGLVASAGPGLVWCWVLGLAGAINFAATLFSQIARSHVLMYDIGVPLYGALILWGLGVISLWRRRAARVCERVEG